MSMLKEGEDSIGSQPTLMSKETDLISTKESKMETEDPMKPPPELECKETEGSLYNLKNGAVEVRMIMRNKCEFLIWVSRNIILTVALNFSTEED